MDIFYEKMRDDAEKMQFQRYMNVGNITVDLAKPDIVSKIMQGWVEGWLSKLFCNLPVDLNNKKDFLVEVKAFNEKRGPVFDIADFRIYIKDLMENPWMLKVSYLIFGYSITDTGMVKINRMWNQNIWEITCPTLLGKNKTLWPLNLQIKKDKVYNIRPGKWYTNPLRFKMYKTKEDFLAALEETVYQNPDTRSDGPDWRYGFLKNYQKHYGEKLEIPRWTDIADNYIIKKK